jgi:hypothetical protein
MGKTVAVTWTCDRSGTVQVVNDPTYPDQFPPGWRFFPGVAGTSVLLCDDCITAFEAWTAVPPVPVA